ncbi:hypothetical protein L798_01156 [Zootermopsis nevadensis]|uniref:Uncharacterized protein n=1 Tax=Zootermopsis nevadensis TaxID=136037 RepID=A0A067QU58_ZOONE|nr:hypothetical protein L798_01156 [Zootermopsis nevadensis]
MFVTWIRKCIIQTGVVTSMDNIVPFKYLQLPQTEQDNTMAFQLSIQLFSIARHRKATDWRR